MLWGDSPTHALLDSAWLTQEENSCGIFDWFGGYFINAPEIERTGREAVEAEHLTSDLVMTAWQRKPSCVFVGIAIR